MSSGTPVACALAELGVPHERVKVYITTGQQRRPDDLALNPNGKLRTLTVDGAPMFEALAIEMWLGQTDGVASGLWPAEGTPENLQARRAWSTWARVTCGAQLMRLQAATDLGTPDDAHGTAARKGLDGLLGLLDDRLDRQPWMLGARLYPGGPDRRLNDRLQRLHRCAGGHAFRDAGVAAEGAIVRPCLKRLSALRSGVRRAAVRLWRTTPPSGRVLRLSLWVTTPSLVECRLCARSPFTMKDDARIACPPPSHHLVRRPGDPVGVPRAIAEPRTCIGERNQLDRDLHDPGFQVDRRGRGRLGACACIGPCVGPLPVLLHPRTGPGSASRQRFGATACTAGVRVCVGFPGRTSNPACLGECAASRTSAVLLIA